MKNPIQMLTNYLQNQLKNRSPQALQTYQTMRANNTDPMTCLHQITSGFSKEQMQGFIGYAKRLGVPDDMLSQIQNGMNSK